MKTGCLGVVAAFILLAAPLALIAQSKNEMPFTSSSPEASKLLRQSWVAYLDAKFDEGNELVNQSLKKDPDFAMGYIFASAASGKERDQNFQKAESSKMSPDEKLFLEGIKAGRKNAPVQEFFDPLLKKYPKDDYLHLMILFNHQDINKRVEIGEGLIKRNPKLAPAHNMLGYTYMEKKEMAKAEASFNKYVSLRPELANVYDSKGDYMMAAGNFKEAVKLYEKAASLGMKSSAVNAQLATLRAKLPKPSDKDVADIKGCIKATSEEYVKGNVDGFLKYYTDQSLEIFGNQISNIGITNIRQRVVEMYKNLSITKRDFEPKSVDGVGTISFAWGPVSNANKTIATGALNENKGNFIYLFKKQGDGSWKILATHAFPATEEKSEEDATKIKQVIANWEAALNPGGEATTEKNHDALGACYSGQAVEIFSNQRANVGVPNMLARWAPLLGSKFEAVSMNVMGSEVIGRRAVAWGVGIQNYYPNGSEVLTKFQYSWGMILTKEKDDVWRILALHWNNE